MEEMVKNKRFRITKKIYSENVFNKLAALNQAYQCFFQVPGYDLDGSDHAVVGMNLLFEETLIELELLLFDERYTESSYIEKAESLKDWRITIENSEKREYRISNKEG